MKSKTMMNSTALGLILIAFSSMTYAEGFFEDLFNGKKSPGVAPVDNQTYNDECGGCHFPYQPGLLPARSWEKLMSSLDEHFGENAELDAETLKALTQYAVTNAADHSRFKRSVKIMRSLRDSETPLRITKTPYIINKHDELSTADVAGNPKVRSLSNCKACHASPETGSFSEDDVRIP
jgi:hypothetical protein